MKRIIVFTLFMFCCLSCSNDDEGKSAGNINTLISQTTFSTSSGEIFIDYMAYNENNRDATWEYSDILIQKELDEPVYSNGNPVNTYKLTLNAAGLIVEAFITSFGFKHAHYYTYDERNRIVEDKIYEQYLNYETGGGNSEMLYYRTYSLTWDDDDNLISIKEIGTGQGNNNFYYVTTFSDFLDVDNTLKTANFGFDFFGPHGFPGQILEIPSSGLFFDKPVFAGKKLPQKKTIDTYYIANDAPVEDRPRRIETLAYQTDENGRLVEALTNYEGGGWSKYRYAY